MKPPLPAAMMLGGIGRYPFNGIFEHGIATPGGRLHVVGRIGASSEPEATWEIVLQVHEALDGIDGEDRLALIRGAWDRVLTLPRQALGPAQGKDLSLFLVASDDTGTSVAGVGLDMIWQWSPERMLPLVAQDHPLLASPGIPQLAPGALTLDSPVNGPLVAAATGSETSKIGPPKQVLQQCGVRA